MVGNRKSVLWCFSAACIMTIAHASKSEKTCPVLKEPSFADHVTVAYHEFKKKDEYNRYYRYLCYGILGTGLLMAIFSHNFPSDSRIQEAKLHAKVETLENQMKKIEAGAGDTKKPTFPNLQALWSYCKPVFDYTIKVFTPGSIAAYVIDKILGNFSYGLMKPIVEPFQHFMNTKHSIAIGNSWFLQEQVRNSSATFVVVSADLYTFVDELKILDLELRHATLLLTTITSSPHINDNSTYNMLQISQQRIHDRLARIIGHIAYLKSKAIDFEKIAMSMLYPRIRTALETALHEYTVTSAITDPNVIKQAIITFDQAVKNALLPLLSVNLYRIHPWPIMAACTEQARAAASESFIATHGNPLY